MKKILINKETFFLQKNTNMKGASGMVYHLVKDKEILAVKIYHEKIDCSFIDRWFPTEDELDFFIECYDSNLPILLSKYKVCDETNNYIGCATDFIQETRGESIEAIKKLPLSLFFKYLYDIKDSITYFDNKKITLCDLQCTNIKLGTIMNSNKERIYIFDDSSYFLDDSPYNEEEINNLVEDISYNYCLNISEYIAKKFTSEMRKHNNYLKFLERTTSGYSNLDECFKDYAKVYKKGI